MRLSAYRPALLAACDTLLATFALAGQANAQSALTRQVKRMPPLGIGKTPQPGTRTRGSKTTSFATGKRSHQVGWIVMTQESGLLARGKVFALTAVIWLWECKRWPQTD